MAGSEAIYDETGSKLLVQALRAETETEAIAALNGLRRYLGREDLPVNDAKIFFASGHPGTWMRGIMNLMEQANKRQLRAEATVRVYRKRLALVEAAIRRFRSILKQLAGSDTADHLLQWEAENFAKAAIDDSDVSDSPQDIALARLLAEIPQEPAQ